MSMLRTLAPRTLRSAGSQRTLPTLLPSVSSRSASLWRPLPPTSSLPPLRSFSSSPYCPETPQHTLGGAPTPIGQIDPLDRRLQITFTCTAPVPVVKPPEGEQAPEGAEARPCGERSSHEFSRRSYEKGVVLVQCPSCNNRHLIADHLSWFSSTPSPSHPTGQPFNSQTPRTVEDLMREKGEEVKWIVREKHEEDGGLTVEIGEATEEEVRSLPGFNQVVTEGEEKK
ncbi:hypothetical protein JCM11251_006787 [Rhodosporidiobolus azoricus]